MESFANRLKQAMDVRNMKASELSEKTGIGKSSISQWLSGKYEAKQDKIYLLATALDVDEAWLMGLDVSMEKQLSLSYMYDQLPTNKKEKVTAYTKQQFFEYLHDFEDSKSDEPLNNYIKLFNSLNDDGKELALDNLKSLQKIFAKETSDSNQDAG
ncbi:helix-turn-helix domain-containing protein [uncultured Vagococcus sp.]|uniref:helix-turn-helix domain-containing protein n=1 Tax=uncultured Vagococcus sp. TaxID=189676 RepID=UPI0028D6F588|nr:helix-turn-helix domain-containing protein [uncultured Vagococcus sp.]